MSRRIAVDIGGTFTDLVSLDVETGKLELGKTSTTPGQLESGVMTALSEVDANDVESLVHGTTQVINTLTERSGARTALITTEGFRDLLEIQRGNRPDMYNVRVRQQKPHVPRRHRFEVRERMDVNGQVVLPLDQASLDRVLTQLEEAQIESVAICLLHSYREPDHENLVAEAVRARFPSMHVSKSHEISREWREYPRTSTAVLDAYVKPKVVAYLDKLKSRMGAAGIQNQRVMLSNGGVGTFEFGASQPIQLVESGPVGGIIGSAELGRAIGRPNVISFDMGGTTAKASLVHDGQVALTSSYHIERTPLTAGFPILCPVVDVVEIGAGGGSIAWIDDGGSLNVGPISAGADPGPAAYGTGGSEPTVCDANVVTGRLNPDYFLGGEMKLDVDAARASFKPIARRLGCSVEEAALGVLQVTNANMTNLIRVVSLQRGYDPRDFTMIAYGGGGPTHASGLAVDLKVPEVVIPIAAGHFSALGMLHGDQRHDLVRTFPASVGSVDPAAYQAVWSEMAGDIRALFGEAAPGGRVLLSRSADLRYVGQEHTVTVNLPDADLSEPVRSEIATRFHEAHERAFSLRLDRQIEIVNVRLAGVAASIKPKFPEIAKDNAADDAREGSRTVILGSAESADFVVYRRDRLGAGAVVEGPAIIEEHATTTLVLRGQSVHVDRIGNLRIQTEGGSK